MKRFGVDELEVEAFPSVGASAAEPPVSEELVQRLDPPVSGVMDSPLVRRASVMAVTAPSQYVSYPEVFHVDE